LPQHFKHMPSEFGEFVEEEDAMMGQRHLARHGHLAAADQSHIGNGLVGRDMGVWSHSRRASDDVFPPTSQQG
jgi:hypothetical protein